MLEEKAKELKQTVKKLLDNGDIELVDAGLNAPLEVKKAIAVTEKGRKWLNGEKIYY